MEKFDVTVSVWNRYWSFPLIRGLVSDGYKVQALGTSRSKPASTSYLQNWPSAFLTQAMHRLPFGHDFFAGCAIEAYETFAARHVEGTRCFWGWGNHHLKAFERAKKLGIPVILECGSTHCDWGFQRLSAEYAKRGISLDQSLFMKLIPKMKAEYELADRICLPSSFTAKTFVESGIPESKLALNPYGADVEFWKQVERRGWPGKDRPFVFVCAAQLSLRKGVMYLLEAWKQLAGLNAELWLVGGIDREISGLLRDLPENVKILGYKSHTELRDLYAKCDVYVLPSLEEGMARSVLEAMAAGLPVIVTEETGLADVIKDGEGGWFVPSADSEVLAAQMRETYELGGDLPDIGILVRKKVEAFTWLEYGKRAAKWLHDFHI